MPDLRERRRAEILDAARTIVARDGLDRLTIGAIEREVDFTRGVITYHFDNKDEIVAALLDDAVQDIDRQAMSAALEAPDGPTAVEAVIRTLVRGFLDHRDATQVLLSFWGRLRSDPRAREANAALYRAWRHQARRLIRQGQIDGHFRDDVDVDAASAVMVGAVIGIATQAVFEDGVVDVDAAVRVAGRSLGGWLFGRGGIP